MNQNMIQKAFGDFNKMDTLESIKSARTIERTVQQGLEAYEKAIKEAENAKESTPVVTAEDIKKEMFER